MPTGYMPIYNHRTFCPVVFDFRKASNRGLLGRVCYLGQFSCAAAKLNLRLVAEMISYKFYAVNYINMCGY